MNYMSIPNLKTYMPKDGMSPKYLNSSKFLKWLLKRGKKKKYNTSLNSNMRPTSQLGLIPSNIFSKMIFTTCADKDFFKMQI